MVRDLDLSTSQFMGFYAWYSWPNVILCFFGGFLIDRVFGVRIGAIIFSLFVTAGQVCAEEQGPVVQSIVSLTMSLRHYFVKYMPTTLSNPLLFFVVRPHYRIHCYFLLSDKKLQCNFCL